PDFSALPIVGVSLLAIAIYLYTSLLLTHRHREQAHSYRVKRCAQLIDITQPPTGLGMGLGHF
ncbi:hypothetical protein ABE529_26305, partial [Pseudomonas koreensis]